jgi:hypothetical protein
VTFSSSYTDAVRAITDLGLVPAASVRGSAIGDYESGGAVYRGPWWQPVGADVAFTTENGTLVVFPTPLAAPNWPDRLRGLPGATVDTLYTRYTPFNGPPHTVRGTPPPGASKLIAPDQLDVTARMIFARPSVDYDSAVDAVTDLGLRLADPCYELAKSRGPAPTWHPMGQEGSYASGGALAVAPTSVAAANWQDQPWALPSVTTLDIPFAPSCS